PVAWVNVGFHHVNRDEDQSPMPIHWQGFTLYPRDFSAMNPMQEDCRRHMNGDIRETGATYPCAEPAPEPTPTPTVAPTETPTVAPTEAPTGEPTAVPTDAPTTPAPPADGTDVPDGTDDPDVTDGTDDTDGAGAAGG